jgi:hypothetical protein
MEYTLIDKYQLIKNEILKCSSKNPIDIIKTIMHKEFINITGPEHHYLDGASFLVAYKNAGGNINVDKSLEMLAERTIKMPGAMCGYWGVCGSVTSVGAALSIIHETGPLTSNQYYSDNMEFTSFVINRMSEIGGPRCCKRNAFLSLECAVKFVKEKYGIEMELNETSCEFTKFNKQCIGVKCPFFKVEK